MKRRRMRDKYRKREEKTQSLAQSRIVQLFGQAHLTAKKHSELADRYVKLAWNIKLKTKTQIPSPYNRQFCRKCLSYWGNGKVRVRTQGKHIVYTCLVCKEIRRLVYH